MLIQKFKILRITETNKIFAKNVWNKKSKKIKENKSRIWKIIKNNSEKYKKIANSPKPIIKSIQMSKNINYNKK